MAIAVLFLMTVLLFCVGICVPSVKRRSFHVPSAAAADGGPPRSRGTSTSSAISSRSRSTSSSSSSSTRNSRTTTSLAASPEDVAPTSAPAATGSRGSSGSDQSESALFTLSGSLSGQNLDSILHKLKTTGNEIKFSGPTSHQAVLTWKQPPRRILFLAKPHPEIFDGVEKELPFLVDRGLELFVEESLYHDLVARDVHEYVLVGDTPVSGPPSSAAPTADSTSTSTSASSSATAPVERRQITVRLLNKADPRRDGIDLVVAFGGDGLLMHCNTLFGSGSIPPSMCFNFGSLGFLAPFAAEDFEEEVEQALRGPVLLTLRMKLECTLWKSGEFAGTYHVLNEIVIDRGPSPFLSMIDVECDGQYLTTVQGDGIIVATPTGSTAYSLAAGGSMVHPSVPAILVTPICAHTLSFRPLLLPDSSVLMCTIPSDCRSSGWVCFDGKFRQELERGDRIEVKLSPYPMPTVNRQTFTGDWFDALRSGFMFNSRPRQKAT